MVAKRTAEQTGRQADVLDVWHTGPGTLAGRYLRTFWQPVWRAQDLPPGRAVPIEIMSEHFTLYRGEGGVPHVVSFRCAHRGTQLSTGWVEGDNIRCRYHGWMYDGTGRCVQQPGEPESFAAKVQIRSYPTQEFLGLIFVYFAEGEPPPMRRHPDFEGPGILDLEVPEYWPCNYFNRVENACDAAHVPYTHYESLKRARQTRGDAIVPPRGPDLYFLTAPAETAYGIRSRATHFHMPNANQDDEKGTGNVAASGRALSRRGVVDGSTSASAARIRWRVPVNDGMNVTFSVTKLRVSEEEAERYRKNRHEYDAFLKSHPPTAVADEILAGKKTVEGIDRSATIANTFSIEDYVTQVGQPPVGERETDRLGTIDQGVILLRKVWQRELKAFAEGRPTKQWGAKE